MLLWLRRRTKIWWRLLTSWQLDKFNHSVWFCFVFQQHDFSFNFFLFLVNFERVLSNFCLTYVQLVWIWVLSSNYRQPHVSVDADTFELRESLQLSAIFHLGKFISVFNCCFSRFCSFFARHFDYYRLFSLKVKILALTTSFCCEFCFPLVTWSWTTSDFKKQTSVTTVQEVSERSATGTVHS